MYGTIPRFRLPCSRRDILIQAMDGLDQLVIDGRKADFDFQTYADPEGHMRFIVSTAGAEA